MNKTSAKIQPHKIGDGGVLCCPMKKNVPVPKNTSWNLITCPVCGCDCWSSDTHKEALQKEPDLKYACTECALKSESNISAFLSAAQYLEENTEYCDFCQKDLSTVEDFMRHDDGTTLCFECDDKWTEIVNENAPIFAEEAKAASRKQLEQFYVDLKLWLLKTE